jgi:hypothetical protein
MKKILKVVGRSSSSSLNNTQNPSFENSSSFPSDDPYRVPNQINLPSEELVIGLGVDVL